jgi:hypothetical protein
MTLEEFTDAVENTDYSDRYIAELYGNLVVKNIRWRLDNRLKQNANNPFVFIDNGDGLAFIKRKRPEVYEVLTNAR